LRQVLELYSNNAEYLLHSKQRQPQIRSFTTSPSIHARLRVPASIQSAPAPSGLFDQLCYEPIRSTSRISRTGLDRPALTEFFFPSCREIRVLPRPDERQSRDRVCASIWQLRSGRSRSSWHLLVRASACAFVLCGVTVLDPRPEPLPSQVPSPLR